MFRYGVGFLAVAAALLLLVSKGDTQALLRYRLKTLTRDWEPGAQHVEGQETSGQKTPETSSN